MSRRIEVRIVKGALGRCVVYQIWRSSWRDSTPPQTDAGSGGLGTSVVAWDGEISIWLFGPDTEEACRAFVSECVQELERASAAPAVPGACEDPR